MRKVTYSMPNGLFITTIWLQKCGIPCESMSHAPNNRVLLILHLRHGINAHPLASSHKLLPNVPRLSKRPLIQEVFSTPLLAAMLTLTCSDLAVCPNSVEDCHMIATGMTKLAPGVRRGFTLFTYVEE